nr:maco-A 36 [Mamestra configurata nucleopolyhedrovirus A]
MFDFINKFLFGHSNCSDVVEETVSVKKPRLAGFSYLFKKKRLQFDEQFSFTMHYLFNDELWLAACAFADGIGFVDSDAAVYDHVDGKYKRSVNQLLFNDNGSQDCSVVCINKHGVLQLLDNIDFVNKAEFTAWLLDNVFVELEGKFVPSPLDEKLTKVLQAIDGLQQHNSEMAQTNEQFKLQVIEKFDAFDRRVAELNDKMNMYENVDDLYRRLREHHRTLERPQHLSFLSSSNTINDDHDQRCIRFDTVRFPRDTSKHPRLSVFVKPVEEGCTKVAFVASQQRRICALKRKYSDMEMIYDSVHPNPQLAMQCINEELELKNLDYKKKSRRIMHINCSVDTAKSFIHENL